MSQIKEKNIDQSNKAVDGNSLNKECQNMFIDLANQFPETIFVGPKEYTISAKEFLPKNSQFSHSSITTDNMLFIINHKRKIFVVIVTDCMLTIRERKYGKGQEGETWHMLFPYFVGKIKKSHPEFKDYRFYTYFVIGLPDKVDIGKYQSPEKEERDINTLIVDINYLFAPEAENYETGSPKVNLAARISELKEIISDFAKNLDTINFEEQNSMRALHIEKFIKTEYQPQPELSLDINLDVMRYYFAQYKEKDIISFLKANSVRKYSKFNKKGKFELAIKTIQEYQDKNQESGDI